MTYDQYLLKNCWKEELFPIVKVQLLYDLDLCKMTWNTITWKRLSHLHDTNFVICDQHLLKTVEIRFLFSSNTVNALSDLLTFKKWLWVIFVPLSDLYSRKCICSTCSISDEIRPKLWSFIICSKWPWPFQNDLDLFWSTNPRLKKHFTSTKSISNWKKLVDMSLDKQTYIHTQQHLYDPLKFFSGSIKMNLWKKQ
jgi:hypothetical protein